MHVQPDLPLLPLVGVAPRPLPSGGGVGGRLLALLLRVRLGLLLLALPLLLLLLDGDLARPEEDKEESVKLTYWK